MPLPVPGYRWEVVSLDFITDLPKTNNAFDAVCVFVDKLTKMVHIAPTVSDCDASELAQIFLRDIYRLHGLPKQILHDRGTQFMSRFFTRLCAGLGIQQLPSTAFHPQTDGQTERVNRVLEDLLRHFTNAQQTNWDTLLPMVEFAINNAKHASSGFTPFFLNYGLHPKTPLSIQVPSVEEAPVADLGAPAVTKFVADLQATLATAKTLLKAAQDRQKACADKRRSSDPDFSVGQEVLLSSKNIPLKHPGSHKLLPRWLGPFRVAKRISSVAYKLELPQTMSRLHPVFHTSLLKPYYSDGPYQPPPPVLLQDGSEEYEVEAIVSHRDRKLPRSSRTVREYLIKWQGYAHEHNTWEPASNLTNCADLLSDYLARVQTNAGTRRRSVKRKTQASRKRKSRTK
jgi:transposase InsO family protein